jgi:hypothetical protein
MHAMSVLTWWLDLLSDVAPRSRLREDWLPDDDLLSDF